jgi:hypothetical protein
MFHASVEIRDPVECPSHGRLRMPFVLTEPYCAPSPSARARQSPDLHHDEWPLSSRVAPPCSMQDPVATEPPASRARKLWDAIPLAFLAEHRTVKMTITRRPAQEQPPHAEERSCFLSASSSSHAPR